MAITPKNNTSGLLKRCHGYGDIHMMTGKCET